MNRNALIRLLKKNIQYVIVFVLFIVLVVVLAVASGKSKGEKKEGDKAGKDKSENEEEIEVPDVPLEKDVYPEVNELMNRYFTAMGEGDGDTLTEICYKLGDKELIRLQKKAEYIEGYKNIECYTKPGPAEGEYITFGYYEIKFKNIDTMIPGLSSLYLKKKDDGSLFVYNGKLDKSVRNYLKAICEQNDVSELVSNVDTKYKEALNGDETLKAFMEALPTALEDEVNKELAAKESGEGSGDDSSGKLPEGTRAGVKENVNVRKEASKDSEKLGQLLGKDTVPILELRSDGWTKIDFNGQEAYVKTEFLELPSGIQAPAADASAEAADAGAQPEGEGQAAAAEDNAGQAGGESQGAQEASGRVEAKEAVSIRKGPGTDSEKVGSAYKGDKFDLLGVEGEWSKIKYNGQTAYIKSEFVSKI